MSAAEKLKDEPTYRPQTKLFAVFFVESVNFGGETNSANIGRNVDSIVPARLEKDGSVAQVEANQRADGILLRKKHHNPNTREYVMLQAFVPFANLRSIQYGD